MIITDLFESPQICPECGGPSFSDLILAEKKDACYHKVKASAKVWPSAYASGRLVQCRKKGADNYGNSKNEGVAEAQLDEKCWDGYQQQGMKNKSGRQVPNCVPAESVNEMDKSQTPPGRDGSNDSDAGKKEYTATLTNQGAVARQGSDILNKAFIDSQRVDPRTGKKMNTKGVAEEYELAGVGVAYELGRRAYKQGMTIRDNPYSATKEARKNDEWEKGLERGKHDANDARHFRSSVKEQAVAEGTLEPGVNHRGDVDLNADIEVLGVDYNTRTFKITYNGKPYTVKTDYFSREDFPRWQIPDYDVEIINRNGKNIMNMIDWDNEGSSKTDRQIKMVNTIIAYLDTENAQDIQYMAWKDQELDNVTAHEFYNDIRNFYKNNKQKIDQTVQWLLKNMTNDQAREDFADYIKNPVNPLDWNTKENLKNNRTYLMYVAFSYSREGNTEMTPGMNLPKIQLNDPDDEDELQQQLDALFKKVEFKFDAFENKIVELGDKFGFNPPDLGSGMGAREMFWDLTMQTAWPKEFKRQEMIATNILNFKAAVDKYAKSFNSSLIKIGLPGISEYAIWYGVLSDDLTQQQVDYFATPEGFANVANGKINVSKMINDNMQRKSLEEKLGDNRPKLGSKRDAGKSIRKWRKTRGLDETGVAETMATFSAKASTRNSGSGEFRGVSIPSDMKHPEWREPTWSFQEIAQKLGIPVATLNLLAFNRIGGFPEALSGLSARHGSKKYYKQSEVKRWVNANNVREKLKQGVAEDQLDEKSVSQAQFRTMAAAAHNPEFAKKVGIKQSVAKEFNRADKGSNYKKLHDRTTEGEIEKTKTGIVHHSSGAYGGGEAPRAPYDPGKYAKDIDHLDKNLTAKLDKSMGIKWPHGNKKSDIGEGEQQKGADYRDPPEADYGDDYQDMVSRVKKLAGLGPLKTVYDPARRVYRNVPTAVQPKK